jgi:hypothetical protein
MHGDSPSFHDNVIIDDFLAGVPRYYFLRRPAKCKGEPFIVGLKGTIAQVAQYLCSFILSRAPVIDGLIREISS